MFDNGEIDVPSNTSAVPAFFPQLIKPGGASDYFSPSVTQLSLQGEIALALLIGLLANSRQLIPRNPIFHRDIRLSRLGVADGHFLQDRIIVAAELQECQHTSRNFRQNEERACIEGADMVLVVAQGNCRLQIARAHFQHLKPTAAREGHGTSDQPVENGVAATAFEAAEQLRFAVVQRLEKSGRGACELIP